MNGGKAECCNEECAWTGNLAECVAFKNDPNCKPHCPECHEVVELCSPETVKSEPL